MPFVVLPIVWVLNALIGAALGWGAYSLWDHGDPKTLAILGGVVACALLWPPIKITMNKD